MSKITRRKMMGQAAAVAGSATIASRGITEAAPGMSGARTASSAQEKAKLLIYHIWGTPPGGTPAENPHPMTQVIEAFNAQSTTVEVESLTPGNYYETLQKTQADIAAGNPPDLVSVPWAFLNYAIDGLSITPIADVAGDQWEAMQASMAPEAWDLVTRDDVAYGFPWALSTPIFYYNADVFEQAGVDPAEAFDTWEKFAAACPTLQEALGEGNPVFALSYNKDWPAQTLIQSNGGRVMNDDGTFGITSEESKQALQTIADLDKAGFYDRGTSDELRPNFIAGTTAVWQASVASLGGVNSDAPFKAGTSTWPKFGEKPVKASTGGSFLGSFATDESKFPAIVEFLTFCASEEGYNLWNQVGYINISTHEVERLPGQEPAYAQYETGLIRETNWPSARGTEAGNTWDTYVQRMWANDIPVEEGVNAALEEITSIIGA